MLPRYLAKDGVVAVGELGYDSMTPEEDEVFATQLALAATFGCRPWCTPRTATRRPARPAPSTSCASRASRPERVVVDHLNETTVAEVADSRLLDGLLDLPRHQDGRAPDGRDPARVRHRADARELRRGLGQLRPAEDPQDRPRPCSTRASPSTTSTSCSGRTPSPSTGRADACTSTRCRGSSSTSRLAPVTFEGNSVLRGAQGLMELSYCTNVHPAEDLDGVLEQLDAFAGPGAPGGRARPARRGPLAPGRARRPARGERGGP